MLGFSSPLKTLLKGSFISQFLAFVLTPVITYLYSPGEYGEYAELLNWALIICPIFAFGLERAIPYVDECKQLPLLLRLSYVSIQTLCFLLLVTWFGAAFFDFYNPVKATLVLFIAYLVFYSLMIGYFLVTIGKYREDSHLKILQTLSILFGQVGVGFFKPLSITLLAAELFGRVSAILFTLNKNVSFVRCSIYRGVRKLKQYYTYGLASTVLVALCINLPVILIAFIYNETMSALYFLSVKLLLAPAALLSVSIGRLYYVECCRNNSENKPNIELFKSNLLKLFTFGAVIYIIIALFLPLAIHLLEDSWQGARTIMYILLPLAFVQFFATPLSMTLTAYNKQYYDLIINSCRLLCIACLSGAAYFYNFGFYTFLSGFVLISILCYLAPLFISFSLVAKFRND